MIDFILAGIIVLIIMFFGFSLLSFLTIGLVYSIVAGLKRLILIFRQPDLALK